MPRPVGFQGAPEDVDNGHRRCTLTTPHPEPDRERSTSRHDLTVVLGAVALFAIGVATGAFQVIHESLETRARGLADAAFGILIVGCWAAGVIALLHRRHARDEQHRRTETEAKYQTLVEQVPAVAYAWDPAHEPGTVPAAYISPQIERLLGFTAQQWIEDPELWGRQVHRRRPRPRALGMA